MDGFAVVLGLLIAGTVIAFLTWPWRMQRAVLQPGRSPETSLAWDVQDEALDDQYEAILTTLRDLDFDHAVDKVAEEDYVPLRQALLVEAADLMVQMDECSTTEADLDAHPEAGIPAHRKPQCVEPSVDGSDRSPAKEGTCSTCGRASRPGDLYCAGCGTRLGLACPECERPVDATDHFCAACGAELVPLWRGSHELG